MARGKERSRKATPRKQTVPLTVVSSPSGTDRAVAKSAPATPQQARDTPSQAAPEAPPVPRKRTAHKPADMQSTARRLVPKDISLEASDDDNVPVQRTRKRCKYIDDEAEEVSEQIDSGPEDSEDEAGAIDAGERTEDDSVVEVGDAEQSPTRETRSPETTDAKRRALDALAARQATKSSPCVPAAEGGRDTAAYVSGNHDTCSGKGKEIVSPVGTAGGTEGTVSEELRVLQTVVQSDLPMSVKTSTFMACLASFPHKDMLKTWGDLPSWDTAKLAFTGPPEWDLVAQKLAVTAADASAAAVLAPEGGPAPAPAAGCNLVPSLPGNELKANLPASAPAEKDPVPFQKYEKNVQLKPNVREGGSGTGAGYVVLVAALSHCVWAIQFVERIDGVCKSVYTGTRQHTGTIGCALSCMTPSWYKSKTRQGVRGDATTNDEWFWYRVWLEATKENMEKMVTTLRKNLTEGANQVRTRKANPSDWQDRRNRDTWLRNWTIEVVNEYVEATQTYTPLPWDTHFTNGSIRSLTTGRFSIFAGMSPDQLIAAGGFFSPTSPYNLQSVMENDVVADAGGNSLHITFTED